MTVAAMEESPLEVPKDLAPDAPKVQLLRIERTFKGELEGKGAYLCLQL